MTYNPEQTHLRLMGEKFQPMPHGAGHYLVAVQNLKGERDALAHVDPATWGKTTPLVHFLGPKTAKKQLQASTVRNWVKAAAAVIGGRPCFVDVLRMKPTQPVAMGSGAGLVAEVIFTACRQRGMQFVPVLHVGQ